MLSSAGATGGLQVHFDGSSIKGATGDHPTDADMIRSALLMITNNIGGLSYLHAQARRAAQRSPSHGCAVNSTRAQLHLLPGPGRESEVEGKRRVYYVGSFLANNTVAKRTLAYALNYWCALPPAPPKAPAPASN